MTVEKGVIIMDTKYTEKDIEKIEESTWFDYKTKLEHLRYCLIDYKVLEEKYDFKILENFLKIEPIILENQKKIILGGRPNRNNDREKPELVININGIDVNFKTYYNRTKQTITHSVQGRKGFTRNSLFTYEEYGGEDIWTPYFSIQEKEKERLKELGLKLLIYNEKKSNISRCYLINKKEALEKLENCSKLDFFNLIYEETKN